ncbi:hypothetical protein [Paenibacillus sp. FSL R7-269]|uniref:hypothetical protein n=1 Tax=Paenibacillus sp. FSL R7-269 TaxID=1226755 RepID=UPI001F31C2A8|nr:hypothetical protein [Paenibacillus sp. FSL R7-269]
MQELEKMPVDLCPKARWFYNEIVDIVDHYFSGNENDNTTIDDILKRFKREFRYRAEEFTLVFGGEKWMDYELFLLSKVINNSLGEMLERFTAEYGDKRVSMSCNDEEIVIGSELFALALEVEDISDIAFVRNHYNLDVNVCIRIQLFGSTFYQGLELLFKIMGRLISHIDGNLLFLEDGSAQLLRMEKGQLLVNKALDPYQTKYLTTSLLSLLDHPYLEKEMSH